MKVKYMIMVAVVFTVYMVTLYSLLRKVSSAATQKIDDSKRNACAYYHVQYASDTRKFETATVLQRDKQDASDSLKNEQ